MLGNGFIFVANIYKCISYLESLLLGDHFYSRVVHAFWETYYLKNPCQNKIFFCLISCSSLDRGHLGSQKGSSLHVLRQVLKFNAYRRSIYPHIFTTEYPGYFTVLISYWRMDRIWSISEQESFKYKTSIWGLNSVHFPSTHERLDPLLTKNTLKEIPFFYPSPKGMTCKEYPIQKIEQLLGIWSKMLTQSKLCKQYSITFCHLPSLAARL